MQLSSLLTLIGGGLLVVAQQSRYALLAFNKRQLQTCEEAYGAGAIQCGTDLGFCYNPTIGQSCCSVDSGFCEQGTYCAPVAGYCCLEGEDIGTCAQNAGFSLPETNLPGTATTQRPAEVTLSVPPQVPSVASPTDVQSLGNLTILSVMPLPSEIGIGSRVNSTITWVPISIASKHNPIAAWVTIVVGIGLAMKSCQA